MNRKQWVKFAVNMNRSDKRLRSLGTVLFSTVSHLTPLVSSIWWVGGAGAGPGPLPGQNCLRRGHREGKQTQSVLSDIDSLRQFNDAKLSPEHWEEIGREIKQPHNKLR